MIPLVGLNAPHIRRMAVVFPAPSGPTSPTISPARTCRFRPSTAPSVPKVFTRSWLSRSISGSMLFCRQGDVRGHARLEPQVGVSQGQAHCVEGIPSALDGLDVARGEF